MAGWKPMTIADFAEILNALAKLKPDAEVKFGYPFRQTSVTCAHMTSYAVHGDTVYFYINYARERDERIKDKPHLDVPDGA